MKKSKGKIMAENQEHGKDQMEEEKEKEKIKREKNMEENGELRRKRNKQKMEMGNMTPPKKK